VHTFFSQFPNVALHEAAAERALIKGSFETFIRAIEGSHLSLYLIVILM